MSYDYKKARALGLIAHCEATLTEPVTISGCYRCTAGHTHHVSWGGSQPRVSQTGYDPAFYAALDTADDEAFAVADDNTQAYQSAYDEVLRRLGYGAVVLDDPRSMC